MHRKKKVYLSLVLFGLSCVAFGFNNCKKSKVANQTSSSTMTHTSPSPTPTPASDPIPLFPAPTYACNQDYGMSLYRAVSNGDIETVKDLLETGADPNKGHDQVLTASIKHINIFKLLLKTCIDVDKKDHQGSTALIWASGLKANIEAVKLLLAAGADVDVQDTFGYTALIMASDKEKLEIVRLLLEADANTDFKSANVGYTALMYAIQRGDIEIVELLLEAGADLHIQNNSGRTALSMAKSRVSLGGDYTGIVRLLKYKINPPRLTD